MKVIDGKKIRDELGKFFKKQISEYKLVPTLGILLVGNDKASLSFINVKKRFGEKNGFRVNLYKLDENVSKKELLEKIEEIENDNNALIVQLPLPEKFKDDTGTILENINIKKDVDNLTGKNYFTSPIILSLEKVFNLTLPFLKKERGNVKVAIVGMGKVVGQPVLEYCKQKQIICEVIGRDDFEKIKECDVVISAVGIPHLIKKEFIKKGSILIDYGCSYKIVGESELLCGDFDPDCFEYASKYTPVPGGMGPLVVACLFENVLESAKTI